jgi:hypothetical protein
LGNSENGQPANTTPGATQKQVAELKTKYPDNPLMAASEIKLPDGTTIPDDMLGKFVRMSGKGGNIWNVLQKWAEKMDGGVVAPSTENSVAPAPAAEQTATATTESPAAPESQTPAVSKKRGRPAKAQTPPTDEPAAVAPAATPAETQTPPAAASTPSSPQELSAEEAFKQLMGSHG